MAAVEQLLSQCLEDFARFSDNTDSYHSPDTQLLWMLPGRRKCPVDLGIKTDLPKSSFFWISEISVSKLGGSGVPSSITLGNLTFFITATTTVAKKLVQQCYTYPSNKRQKYYEMVLCLLFFIISLNWWIPFLDHNTVFQGECDIFS